MVYGTRFKDFVSNYWRFCPANKRFCSLSLLSKKTGEDIKGMENKIKMEIITKTSLLSPAPSLTSFPIAGLSHA